MIQLNENTILSIRNDRHLKNKLQLALNISDRSLQNNLDANSQKLVTLDALNIITEHLDLPLSEIITGGKISKLISSAAV